MLGTAPVPACAPPAAEPRCGRVPQAGPHPAEGNNGSAGDLRAAAHQATGGAPHGSCSPPQLRSQSDLPLRGLPAPQHHAPATAALTAARSTAALPHHFQPCAPINVICLVSAVLAFAAARLSSSCSEQGLLSLQSAQASHGSGCSCCLWSGLSGAWTRLLLGAGISGRTRVSRIGRRSLHHGPTKGARRSRFWPTRIQHTLVS